MKKNQRTSADDAKLRRRAEERLQEETGLAWREADQQRLLHELQVHQIELELQNEELQQAKEEIAAGLEKYTELYDFAPTGYFTLDRDGAVRAANLTGADLLGIERARLTGRPFSCFIEPEFRPAFEACLGKVFMEKVKETCELVLLKEGNFPVFVRIEAKLSEDRQECHAAAMDISARRRAESEQERLIGELQETLAHVKTLRGLLPICASCKKIRDDHGYWSQIEAYVENHTEALFSHGICPDCAKNLYPHAGRTNHERATS